MPGRVESAARQPHRRGGRRCGGQHHHRVKNRAELGRVWLLWGSPDRIEVTRCHRGEDAISNPQRPVAELFAGSGEGRDPVRAAVGC